MINDSSTKISKILYIFTHYSMCKKMKAKHYVKNFGAAQCLDIYSNKYLFPELDETAQWCSAESRFNTLLGLSSATQLIMGSILVGILALINLI